VQLSLLLQERNQQIYTTKAKLEETRGGLLLHFVIYDY